MMFWSRTEQGWAVNLDGTDAASQYALPRLELQSGSRGWTCACHLANGTSRLVPLGQPGGIAQAMRLAIEGCIAAVDGDHQAGLRALLDGPIPR